MKVVLCDLDDTLCDTTGRLDGSIEKIRLLEPFPSTHAVLSALTVAGAHLILVTSGNEQTQAMKIDVMGIRSYFKTIYTTPTGEGKQAVFKTIAQQFPAAEHKFFAVGNRIDCEIMYGNMCGFVTVLLMHGKYASLIPQNVLQVPTHTIHALGELPIVLLGKE